eukprot:Rhum_TRINITY_DN3599_c0_g2::Rhum_TRINITY_DN3599_c0_g2_i1::g.11029::m.11029
MKERSSVSFFFCCSFLRLWALLPRRRKKGGRAVQKSDENAWCAAGLLPGCAVVSDGGVGWVGVGACRRGHLAPPPRRRGGSRRRRGGRADRRRRHLRERKRGRRRGRWRRRRRRRLQRVVASGRGVEAGRLLGRRVQQRSHGPHVVLQLAQCLLRLRQLAALSFKRLEADAPAGVGDAGLRRDGHQLVCVDGGRNVHVHVRIVVHHGASLLLRPRFLLASFGLRHRTLRGVQGKGRHEDSLDGGTGPHSHPPEDVSEQRHDRRAFDVLDVGDVERVRVYERGQAERGGGGEGKLRRFEGRRVHHGAADKVLLLKREGEDREVVEADEERGAEVGHHRFSTLQLLDRLRIGDRDKGRAHRGAAEQLVFAALAHVQHNPARREVRLGHHERDGDGVEKRLVHDARVTGGRLVKHVAVYVLAVERELPPLDYRQTRRVRRLRRAVFELVVLARHRNEVTLASDLAQEHDPRRVHLPEGCPLQIGLLLSPAAEVLDAEVDGHDRADRPHRDRDKGEARRLKHPPLAAFPFGCDVRFLHIIVCVIRHVFNEVQIL